MPGASAPPPGDLGLQFAIMVGGFKRKLARHFRQAHYDEVFALKIPDALRRRAQPKFPVMEKHYYLAFEDEDDLKEALGYVEKYDGLWVDPTYGRDCCIYAKRHRSWEARQVGKFRKNFYDVFTAELTKMDKYKEPNSFKLHTARGTMYIQYDNDDLELLSFPKELLKEASSLDINYEGWTMAGVTKIQVDEWIERAIVMAKKQV